jgi:superfamily II DNA helicase RecQ
MVDECHLVLTARHWRENLLKVKNLRLLGCPIVLLTATLPPLQEAELEASMLVKNATYIRASTVRPNARYFVSWCQRKALESTALTICKRWVARLRRTGQKGVVYCLSKAQSERIAEELGCTYYPRALIPVRADWILSEDEIYTFLCVFTVMYPGWNKYVLTSVELASCC